MDESQALTRFTKPDETLARQAFDRLAELRRGTLEAYLHRATDLNAEDRADVVQATFQRVWSARLSFQDQGVPAWLGYLKTVARRCCVDLLRARTERTLECSLEDTLADTDGGAADDSVYEALTAVMTAVEAQDLWHRADLLWLGLDPQLPPETHTRRLLAAQLTYLDGLPWKQVLRLLGPAPPGSPPLSRAVLDEWTADPSVLRHLAYSTLYYSNDRLAGTLLGMPDLDDPAALNALARHVSARLSQKSSLNLESAREGTGGWTWTEVAVILWRYRHALPAEQILLREDIEITREELQAMIDRTLACFPFSEEMWSLLSALTGLGGRKAQEALQDRGLWQRLAFQYRYGADLPHLDIRDRVQPAARHVQTEITPGMLNVWLSNGRLLERLARSCRDLAAAKELE